MEKIAVVIPAYNEEKNIVPMIEAVHSALASANVQAEIIFVDDGSKDNTWAAIQHAARSDSRVKAMRFSRNFGHQTALLAGMEQASGDAIVSMDCDLQHPPEMLQAMVAEWRAGKKIVVATRRQQQESFFKTRTSSLFYQIFKRLSDTQVRENAADFRLLDQVVHQELMRCEEREIFLRGMVSWLGYEVAYLEYDQPERKHGSSAYTLAKMARLALRGLVSFSSRPLYVSFFVGVCFILLSFMYALYIFANMALGVSLERGWASLMLFMMVSSGLQLLSVGILGAYLSAVYMEVKRRPRYVLRDRINFCPK